MESYNGVLYSKSDAFYLIEAARNNIIPLIKQRLSAFERQASIKSGSVFIWNEKNSNIKRWTDGRKWSASRVTGTFLTYKEMKPPSIKEQSCHIIDYKDNGLLKQSFSYNIGNDKYHIVSYINENDNSIKLQRPSHDIRFKSLSIISYIDEVIGCQPIYSSKCKGKCKNLNKDHKCEIECEIEEEDEELTGSSSSTSSSARSSISTSSSEITVSSPKIIDYSSSLESVTDSENNDNTKDNDYNNNGKKNDDKRPTLPPFSSIESIKSIPRTAPTLANVLNNKLVNPLPLPINMNMNMNNMTMPMNMNMNMNISRTRSISSITPSAKRARIM